MSKDVPCQSNILTLDPTLSSDAAVFALTDTFKSMKEIGNRKMSLKAVNLKEMMSHPNCCSLFKVFQFYSILI